jgi:8-oxo-dGTP pyrophosphatase MutT (NUDIX family)
VKLSFPGGRVDPGESIEEAARREALEETGYEFKEWRLVEVVQPHSKIEWFVYTFVAWDVERSTDTNHDAGEKITVEAKPFAEVKKLVMDRSGYLAESEALFSDANGVDDLSRLPEARGKLVERPV